MAEQIPTKEHLGALFALDAVPGFGPVKFRAMRQAGVDPRAAIERPERLPFGGRIGEKLRAAIRKIPSQQISKANDRAAQQIRRARRLSASILVHGDEEYPEQVYRSNNPIPVLYVRGDPQVWSKMGSVAVVGSRATREPFAALAREFAQCAAQRGLLIVSGFAVGADSIGHRAARDVNGRTVCVMPCGLDNLFPPENRTLWEELLAYPGAAFVSEFGFGRRASALLLRKRNKLIAAFAQGVLVAQSTSSGGAMNAYRFAREQKKPVASFAADSSQDTAGNAAIAEDSRTGGVSFSLTAGTSEYETWLDALSSWT